MVSELVVSELVVSEPVASEPVASELVASEPVALEPVASGLAVEERGGSLNQRCTSLSDPCCISPLDPHSHHRFPRLPTCSNNRRVWTPQ